MIIINAAATVFTLLGAAHTDSVAIARRIAASVQLAAQEYRIGVVQGRVVAQSEVDEAKIFLENAAQNTKLLPPSAAAASAAKIEAVRQLILRVGTPDSVDVLARLALDALSHELGIALVVMPDGVPSLARGAQLYRTQCTSCHGDQGRGDGLAAAGISPPPADLADAAALIHATPLSFYQRITIGVAGTAMPAYETNLSAADRWALAAYVTSLRQPKAVGAVPASLRDYAITATLTDQELLDSLGTGAGPQQVAAVRGYQEPLESADRANQVFDSVRTMLRGAVALGVQGKHEEAAGAAFDAYLEFEKVERLVRAKRPDLATRLEAAFATMRTRLSGGAMPTEIDGVQRDLSSALDLAERAVSDRSSPTSLFLESLVIILREGLEAILIIGALMAFLVKTGAGHRRRDIHIGVGAAVALSLLTAVLLQTVFVLSTAHQELIEAWTLAVAVVVLFYVSYWLLSKMEATRWTQFVKERVQVAVTGGSALALASAAFLAVYREGFETVLFYQALFVSGGSGGATFWPVISGLVVGGAALAVVYFAINRYGIRLPLTPFFAVTSAFLYYTAFVFAGKAVAEFQEGGVVGLTPLSGSWPRVPALGIYPTLETMVAQGVLVLLAVIAVAWIFVVKRDNTTPPTSPPRVEVPTPAPMSTQEVGNAPTIEASVLRSLERMDADLSAIKAEVERLRDTVVEASVDQVAASNPGEAGRS